jgi:type IV pilus assembly protein PilA
MALTRRKDMPRALSGEDGFTLIELLVVLIIMGILAVIAIAIFSGQQNKAHDAEAKTGVRSAQIAMETYYTEHNSYSGATVAELAKLQPSLVDAPSLSVQKATSNEYIVQTVSTSMSPVTFTVTRFPNSTIARGCAPANTGGCGPGAW